MMRTSKPEEEDEDKKLKLTAWKKAFLYQLPKKLPDYAGLNVRKDQRVIESTKKGRRRQQ